MLILLSANGRMLGDMMLKAPPTATAATSINQSKAYESTNASDTLPPFAALRLMSLSRMTVEVVESDRILDDVGGVDRVSCAYIRSAQPLRSMYRGRKVGAT